MKQFKVYRHPAGSIEVVKQGWSWPGFFFSCFWAMVKKMWGLGVGVLIAFFVLGFILGLAETGLAGEGILNLAGFIANIIFGMHGNSWRGKNLISRGYDHVDTVTAANPDGANALYLKSLSVNI